ncbi:cholesterol 7-desaturase nvd-like [Lineus longissimus]|uniref:cholesterol 7-desaturase nvd-like n=1 Tax=Lineus longissimus TaxID=88925 RepID=UPI002B4D0C91
MPSYNYTTCFMAAVTFAAITLASASIGSRILKVPLFDVGPMWLQAVRDLGAEMKSVVTSLFEQDTWLCPWTYVMLGITGFCLYVGYYIFVAPLNRIRQKSDLGYVPQGGMSKRDMANLVQKRRVVGDLPPVYPNGWFGVIEAHEVKKGESMSIACLGENFAVFRDDHGEVHILDAYCPHMGANLGVGGRIHGDCITCPFHGWKFRGSDGKCTSIPYADKVPDMAKVKAYPTYEINGWIYVWYHAEGEEPFWWPEEIKEITNGSWSYRGRTEHNINAHIQEIPENGADVAHLKQIHGPILLSGTDIRYMYSKMWDFVKHSWDASWSARTDPDEKHIGSLQLTHNLELFGCKFPGLELHVEARQIGPGIVYLFFNSIFGSGVFVHSLTPTEPLNQKMVHNVYANWTMPTIIAKGYLLGEALQVDRDVMIWNNKRYERRPLFVKSAEDSLIGKHRRWYSQFYSEHSPKLNFQKETLDF